MTPEQQADALEQLRRARCWDKKNRTHVLRTDDAKECIACQRLVPLSNFYSKQSGSAFYFSSACKPCEIERYKMYKSTWRGAVTCLIGNQRHSSKSRNGKRMRDGGVRTMPDSEATMLQWADKLEATGFRCWLTLVLPHGGLRLDPSTLSPERIDNDKPYVEPNWNPVHVAFQSMQASWTRSKVLSVPDLREKESVLMKEGGGLDAALEWCVYADSVLSVERAGIRGRMLRDESVVLSFATQRAAARHINGRPEKVSLVCNGIRKHTQGWHFEYVNGAPPKPPFAHVPPLYTKIRNMIKDAVKDTEVRNQRRSKDGRVVLCHPSISPVDLLDTFRRQEGRCSYLDVPLRLKGDWMMSLERVDNDVGYEASNCRLVAGEVNSAFWRWSRDFADEVWPRCS